MIREVEIEELVIKIGRTLVSCLRYADYTELCAESQEEAGRLVGQMNNIGKGRVLKLCVKKTKLWQIGKIQWDAGVTVDDEQIEVVEHLKYLAC